MSVRRLPFGRLPISRVRAWPRPFPVYNSRCAARTRHQARGRGSCSRRPAQCRSYTSSGEEARSRVSCQTTSCHGKFGPVKISVRRTIFFDKIGPAGRKFLWKNGPGRKNVRVCPLECATCYGCPRAVANTETAVLAWNLMTAITRKTSSPESDIL